jgi:hypothetical protein
VEVELAFNPTPQEVPGKARWTRVDVSDSFIQVEIGPQEEYPDGVTLLVDGQTNSFFFRRGRTEGDTLAASATANNLYVVEWRDRGAGFQVLSMDRGSLPFSRNTTWSAIKTLFN